MVACFLFLPQIIRQQRENICSIIKLLMLTVIAAS